MRTERDTANTIRGWMHEEVELDDRGLAEALARLPDTPQRRHRWLWPFDRRHRGTGATRSAASPAAATQWRLLEMLNATRAAAIVVVLTLSGTLALMAGPLSQSEEPATVPAAETAGADVDQGPAFFSGTATMSRGQQPDITALADRQEFRDAGTVFTLDLDDPRVDGSTATSVYDYDDFSVSGGRMGVFRGGTGRIENDGGAWVLSFLHGAVAEPEDGSSYTYATMTGEGGYEGLVGSMLMTDHDGAGTWQVVGAIFPEQNVAAE